MNAILPTVMGFGVGIIKSLLSESYDRKEVIEQIKSSYTKSCGELTDLLKSSFETIDTDLYSGFEGIYKDYTAAYPDFLASNDALPKYKQSSAFAIKKTIPDPYFDELNKLRIKEVPRSWHPEYRRIKMKNKALIESAAEKTSSSCQAYFESVFESAKEDFLLETEKCRAFYLKELSKLQESITEKLTVAKHTEQKIMALENRIECLNELQTEINKLATS